MGLTGRSGVRIPAGLVYQDVYTGSGAHSAFYTVGTGGFFSEIKRPEREAGHSFPANAKVKNE